MTVGTALRAWKGGPVQVMLRHADFALRVDAERQIGGAGQELVAFQATDYRELGEGSDVWVFDINEAGPDGLRRMQVAVTSADILMVRAEARLKV